MLTKQVRMYGRKSLARAQEYVAQHPDRELVVLKEKRSKRFAVCSAAEEQTLRSQGFVSFDAPDQPPPLE